MAEIFLEGVVVRGRQLGRELGFPTANIALEGAGVAEGPAEGISSTVNVPVCTSTPARGVYRSIITVEGVVDGVYDGVTNVGVNPTVGAAVALRAESYLFDFEGDLYGRRVRVELKERLRDEVRFGSVEELRKQIERDVEMARVLIRK